MRFLKKESRCSKVVDIAFIFPRFEAIEGFDADNAQH
jgi:hypothetical protein